VRFAGVLGPDELRRVYASADIGLAPYVAASIVALPTKLFDYLAAGLPVITSLDIDLFGAGTRYASGNAASLRDAIARVAANRETMSEAANKASEQFDARVLYERFADAIEAVAR
jgi:glycosyltransferase involved in cell wall biosynthesis